MAALICVPIAAVLEGKNEASATLRLSTSCARFLWVQHIGFGIGTKTAGAADVGHGRVVCGAARGDCVERFQHLFSCRKNTARPSISLAGVQTILKSQPLAPLQT